MHLWIFLGVETNEENCYLVKILFAINSITTPGFSYKMNRNDWFLMKTALNIISFAIISEKILGFSCLRMEAPLIKIFFVHYTLYIAYADIFNFIFVEFVFIF